MLRRGFSLIELLITVAIIGSLAAIALPSYATMQLRAKRAEAGSVLEGVAQAEIAYHAVADAWQEAESNPGMDPDRGAHAWDPAKSGWSALGFAPDGAVRCTYLVGTYNSGSWARADAYCDVDDDNQPYIARFYVPSNDPAEEHLGLVEIDPTRY